MSNYFLKDGQPLQFAGNWSFSTLMDYETCSFRVALAKIHKSPKPALPPDNPLERGNRIHNTLEKFVKGEVPTYDCEARGISKFEEPLLHLRELYAEGNATAEQDWLFDRDWNLTYKNAAHASQLGCPDVDPASLTPIWLWSKLDFCVTDMEEGHAIIGDYKSGKSQYKLYEHTQQLQLYAAITALKFEWADKITTELWYVDEGWVKPVTMTREQALKFVGRFDRRAQQMYDDRVFKPRPNQQTCRFCPFGPETGTGVCPVGIKR